jgi:hypothetical protein
MPRGRILGLISEPDEAGDLADDLAGELPERLDERLPDGAPWHVEVRREPTADGVDLEEFAELARRDRDEGGWDAAVGLTDLPLHDGDRTLVAAVSTGSGVALISLPALAGLLVHRRARKAVLRVTESLVADRSPDEAPAIAGPHAPHRRADGDGDELFDHRIVATPVRGRLRLLLGMVAANRPWRLLPGLSSAIAAALATSAYGLLTVTVWMLSDRLGVFKLALAMLASIALMVGWLILDHNLWEHAGDEHQTPERAALYNTATILTLGAGVALGYLCLFTIDLLVALVLVDRGVLSQNIGHPGDFGNYVTLAWLTASAATVGGALGSSLESEEAVRRAAYGARQRQRLAALREDDGENTE